MLKLIVIVIVNSRFLQRPQERSGENQLIHWRWSKTKSIGSLEIMITIRCACMHVFIYLFI